MSYREQAPLIPSTTPSVSDAPGSAASSPLQEKVSEHEDDFADPEAEELLISNQESTADFSSAPQNTGPTTSTPPTDIVTPEIPLPQNQDMVQTKIRSFQGLRNGLEDPSEFLEDLEWA